MQPDLETLLCRNKYDPLDRLVSSAIAAKTSSRRFYQKDRLVTEVQGALQYSLLQHGDQLLAQHQRETGNLETRLLATDQQRSV